MAEWLAAAPAGPVTLVSPDPVAGTLLARTGDLADANVRLQRAGVARQLRARITAVGGGCRSTGVDVWTGRDLPPARRPSWSTAGTACPTTTSTGRSATRRICRVGDCVAPRTVHEAVLEGRRAALALLGAPGVAGLPSRASADDERRRPVPAAVHARCGSVR